MIPHSPPPVGAIRTRVLLLLIALIVCGAVGTVILSHFLRADDKPAAVKASAASFPSGFAQVNRFAHYYL